MKRTTRYKIEGGKIQNDGRWFAGKKRGTERDRDREREKGIMHEARKKSGCVSASLVEDLAVETIGSICIWIGVHSIMHRGNLTLSDRACLSPI